MSESEFQSERLTTPGRDGNRWSREMKERMKNASVPERNRMFHDVMEPFSSIVI